MKWATIEYMTNCVEGFSTIQLVFVVGKGLPEHTNSAGKVSVKDRRLEEHNLQQHKKNVGET